jgi:chitinase
MGYQFYGPGPNNAQDPRAGAFLPVIYAMRDSLTLLTVQDYNSGPITGLDNQFHTMGGADFHIAMTDMLLTGFPVAGKTTAMFPALAPSPVAIGVPANTNAGNGWLPDAQLDQALDCLTKATSCGTYQTHGTHPDLRGLMTWSINWTTSTASTSRTTSPRTSADRARCAGDPSIAGAAGSTNRVTDHRIVLPLR